MSNLQSLQGTIQELLKRASRSAKTKPCQNFCEEFEGTSEISSLRNTLSNNASTPGFSMKANLQAKQGTNL